MGTVTMGREVWKHETGRLVDPAATPSDRQYATWIHMAGLICVIVAASTHLVTFWMPPLVVLIMWLSRRHDSAFVEDHGKEAVNFQISLVILSLLAWVIGLLACGVGWIVTVPFVFVLGIVGLIMAALAAKRGEYFRYPMCIRLL